MSKIKNIIFDFDGTLADTTELIVATMQTTIRDMELPFKDKEDIKATIGIRLEEVPSILWPDREGLGLIFSKNYKDTFEKIKKEITVSLYPRVSETLYYLKNSCINLSIATSRSRKSVEELTLQLGIKKYFDFILGGDEVSSGKPNPESILTIIDKMGWKQDETLMVGDMAVDILMGQNAGVLTCGVVYGNGQESELLHAGAIDIISEFSELTKYITQ